MKGKYTTVVGNAEQARAIMNTRFGNQWASIYAHAENEPRSTGPLHYGAGVEKYHLEYFDYTAAYVEQREKNSQN